MIILTSKRLNALKEEIKADLKEEVTQETIRAVICVFRSLFTEDVNLSAFGGKKGQTVALMGLYMPNENDPDRNTWDKIWRGAGISDEAKMRRVLVNVACNIANILDYKVKTHYKDQIAELVTEHMQGEEFMDEVVNRINRKQLIQ